MPNDSSKRITRNEVDRLVNSLPDANPLYAAAISREASIQVASLALLATNAQRTALRAKGLSSPSRAHSYFI